MRTNDKRLLISVFAALVVLVTIERAFDHFSRERFGPIKEMERAVAHGDGCVLFVGDSKMLFGARERIIEKELQRQLNPSICVVKLAFPGASVAAQVAAVKEYLRHGKRPKLVVIGFGLGELMQKKNAYFSTSAAALLWSQPQDVAWHGTERAEFLWKRISSFGVFGWILWHQAQTAQNKFASWFGSRADVERALSPEDDLAERLPLYRELIEGTLYQGKAGWQEDPAYKWLRARLSERAIPFVLVELPIRPEFTALTDSLKRNEELEQLRRWYRSPESGQAPVAFIEAGAFNEIPKEAFTDAVHMSPDGGLEFSKQLANLLLPYLR